MSSKREKLDAQKTIVHSLENETICPKDDARRLNNLLQPSRYPAKDRYDLHRKITLACKIH